VHSREARRNAAARLDASLWRMSSARRGVSDNRLTGSARSVDQAVRAKRAETPQRGWMLGSRGRHPHVAAFPTID
jgi:hypothetical protein